MSDTRAQRVRAAAIVQDAGGTLVGRTRLQKVAYLLQLAGFCDDFDFEYYHYGPYSEDLTYAMRLAVAEGRIVERERATDWGSYYSIFQAAGTPAPRPASDDEDRRAFVEAAAAVGAVEIELAATAAFLAARENVADPWEETRKRKPEKAGDGRLEKAREAYARLAAFATPRALPQIA